MSEEAQALAYKGNIEGYKKAKDDVHRLTLEGRTIAKDLEEVARALKAGIDGTGLVSLPSTYPTAEKVRQVIEDLRNARGQTEVYGRHLDDYGIPRF